MKSSKDVEQLLDCVLRMPYVRSRQQAELGKAYAYVVSTTAARAADGRSRIFLASDTGAGDSRVAARPARIRPTSTGATVIVRGAL